MKKINIVLLVGLFLLLMPLPSVQAEDSMIDFTSLPAFIEQPLPPNIMVLMDFSGSMQCPAYFPSAVVDWNPKGGLVDCSNSDSNSAPENMYDPAKEYYGYFESGLYYKPLGSSIKVNVGCDTSGGTDKIGKENCISGNLLNWATTSKIDVLRKALMGGKAVSTQCNTNFLLSQSGKWIYDDGNLGCSVSVSDAEVTFAPSAIGFTNCETNQTDHFDGLSFDNVKWNIAEINTSTPGNQVQSNGQLTVTADFSAASFSGTSIPLCSNTCTIPPCSCGTDSFSFVYQDISGDFDVRLFIGSPDTGMAGGMAGLMVRNGTDPGSKYVGVFGLGGFNQTLFGQRAADNNNATPFNMSDAPNAKYAEPLHKWVRIVRTSATNTFTVYYSDDGASWKDLYSTTDVVMADPVQVGMATASSASGVLINAVYNDFTLCTGECSLGNFTSVVKAEYPDGVEVFRAGVIQSLTDKDLDCKVDPGAPRFGLMVFSGDAVGLVRAGIEGQNMSSFINSIQDEVPKGDTPFGKALYEVYDYFTQKNNYNYDSESKTGNNNPYIGGPGSIQDPWYDNGKDPSPCRKSFVLVVSDGQLTDADISPDPLNATSLDPVDPARLAHVTDLRPDGLEPDLPDMQNLTYYTVYAMGDTIEGKNCLEHTSMFGAFKDKDNNKHPFPYKPTPQGGPTRPVPDSRKAKPPSKECDPLLGTPDDRCKEWDVLQVPNPDGVPDTYFEAQDGQELEASIIKAIEEMIRKATSGTAVSVLSTSGEGEGALYQAYFYPAQTIDGDEYKWLGYLQGFFVDKYGNIRADTNHDKKLNYGIDPTTGACTESMQDSIVRLLFDESLNKTRVHFFIDKGCDGEYDSGESYTPTGVPVEIDNFTDYLWEAGEELHKRIKPRDIFTTIDGSTKIPFIESNAPVLKPFMQQVDDVSAAKLINYFHGVDYPEYRSRTFDGDTWKLGDIINSSPVTIAGGVEFYADIYSDASYGIFKDQMENRRQVVYVGANDGMLHAFNAGLYDSEELKFNEDTGHTLGQELWAFIPKSLLPHLGWYADPNYTHVYYVDGKPRIFDARIFAASDSTNETDPEGHDEGWGTVLIGSMRFGGKKGTDVKVCDSDRTKVCTDYLGNDNGVCSTECTVELGSSYFAIDVTNPTSPRLLWTFDDPDNLGLTTSTPSIMRKDDGKVGGPGDWYLGFGSGPTDYDGSSTQNGSVYVLKLNSGNNGVVKQWCTTGSTDPNCANQSVNYWVLKVGDDPGAGIFDENALMGSGISIDYNANYDVEAMYIGDAYCPGNATCPPIDASKPSPWKGKMYRIETDGTPDKWEVTTFLDPEQPCIVSPSAARDSRGNLWLYFGTGMYLSGKDNLFYVNNPNNPDPAMSDSYYFYGVKEICSLWDPTVNCENATMDVCPFYPATTSTFPVDPIPLDALNDTTGLEVRNDKVCTNSGSSCYYDSDCNGGFCVSEYKDFTSTFLPKGRECDKAGWKMRLYDIGERTVSKPVIFSGMTIWSTYLPTQETCTSTGKSFLYAVSSETGTATDYEFFHEDPTADPYIDRREELGPGIASIPKLTGGENPHLIIQKGNIEIDDLKPLIEDPIKSKLTGTKDEEINFDVIE